MPTVVRVHPSGIRSVHGQVTVASEFHVYTDTINPGAGQTVICLHGLGASPESMELFVWLARRLNVTVLAPHLPNHGPSSDVATFDEYLVRLGQWMEAVGFGRGLVLGHSFGALVTPFLAEAYPGSVASAVLLSLPTEPLSGSADLNRRLRHVGADVVRTTTQQLALAWATGRGRGFTRGVASTARDGFRLGLMRRVLEEVPPVLPVLSSLTIPLVEIHGGDDVGVPPPRGDILPVGPMILPRQGHCFPLSRATWPVIADAALGQLHA